MPPSKAHLKKAIGKIQERGVVPAVDFTQHQLENGYTISTQERVVKDVRLVPYHPVHVSYYEKR